MSHQYNVEQRVRHIENGMEGKIVKCTTLGEVVDGDCELEESDQPWYEIEWDEDCWKGLESEKSLVVSEHK